MFSPHPILAIPFASLLIMIATGPIFYPNFWHRFYPHISIGLGSTLLIYYAYYDSSEVAEFLAEYLLFIAYISSLYMASSGILISLVAPVTPMVNLTILIFGAIISNIIGTTGASMLLIRPFMRLNKDRLAPYQIIFFIFMVSNIGGALTPIGDPPLFLGFLKGVPFLWSLFNNFFPWLVMIVGVGSIFFFLDRMHLPNIKKKIDQPIKIKITGSHNIIWLILIIGTIFLDPKLWSWLPTISYHNHSYSFLREILLFFFVWASYKFADKKALKENGFSLEPIKEVVLLFFGIFATMIPMLALLTLKAQSEGLRNLLSPKLLYCATGICSAFLDNAPTYISFLAASMGAKGMDIGNIADVLLYVSKHPTTLRAISTSAVFFGAMTYIGNGPNMMVKSIAESQGVKMPSFFGYLGYAMCYLLPMLIVVLVLFCR